MNKRLNKIVKPIAGHIHLAGSKSISNRVLIINALCNNDCEILGLANADDTEVLLKVLTEQTDLYDVHHAGTSYRFLCSLLAMKEGEQILTGSSRMKERPIGPLVDALREIGANIEYLENEGYPPLKIGEAKWNTKDTNLKIDATISSQFISSLLLISPCLPDGLRLELIGDLVSRPYLEMTLGLMKEFGVEHNWVENVITVLPQKYVAKSYEVEADWSAASYYFGLVALIPGTELSLGGLRQNSIQGDSKIVEMMKQLGVSSHFENGKWFLKYIGNPKDYIEQDFLRQPDLAQTISVVCAGLGTTALFSGLQTLSVKETDRIKALQNELLKVNVFLSKLPAKFSKNPDITFYMQEGLASSEDTPIFETYRDHRMALAFSMLSAKLNIEIEDPNVVTKSYPDYWNDYYSLTSIMH